MPKDSKKKSVLPSLVKAKEPEPTDPDLKDFAKHGKDDLQPESPITAA